MALLLLYGMLLLYSVLDESLQTAQVSLFEVDSQSKCPDDNDLGGTPTDGTYLLTPEKITFCALSCAVKATCAFFSWTEHSSASNMFYCRLLPGCSRKESNTDTNLYRRTFPGELITVDFQVIVSFQQNYGKACAGTVIRKWQKGSLGSCELMCLLDDECISITTTRDQDECLFKATCGGYSTNNQADTYTKPYIAVCVPGFSCYVSFLSYMRLSKAKTVCNEVGGQLASLQTVEEQIALAPIVPHFKAGERPQWVGLLYESGSWNWLGGTLSGSISWAPDSPAAAEGMYAMLDPVLGKYTARAPSERANALCEVPSITTVIEHGVSSVKHELSDGDLTTCVPAPSHRSFTARRFIYTTGNTTTNNVKLYGDKLKCADDIETTNVFVMNDISSKLTDETRKYRRCTMALQYVWKDKDLCLYHCPCVDSTCWKVVVKAKADVEGLTVCEIVII